MPTSTTLTYDCDTTIAAIASYYEFLAKIYMPASAIKRPPPEGWPSITPTTFAALEKTDGVIDLLRHLPYIDRVADIQCAPHCYFADYRRGVDENSRVSTEPDESVVEPHIVGLTMGGRDNQRFLLDTKLGIVYWVGCPAELETSMERVAFVPESDEDEDDDVDEDEESWRDNAPAWTVQDFFEVLKEEFLAMRFTPSGVSEVIAVYSAYADEGQNLVPYLQRLMRESGWSDVDNFRKENYLETLEATASTYNP